MMFLSAISLAAANSLANFSLSHVNFIFFSGFLNAESPDCHQGPLAQKNIPENTESQAALRLRQL
jgi:hypothetical protein